MLIDGGYYIKARIIMESEIMKQPPHVREVWDWLLMNANHKQGKSSGKLIERGQLFVRLDDIREGLSWFVGYRKERYTKDHMKKAMKALKKASMISTNVSTRGMLITICNYDKYQNPRNYKATNESTNESTNGAPVKHQTGAAINKNNNNENNENKSIGDFSNFDIEKLLDDNSRQAAKQKAPGWDLYYLMPKFNDWIKTKPTPDNPVGAFINWCGTYTKGKEL